MFGYYKIDNLCIGEMRIVTSRIYDESDSTNIFLILQKLYNSISYDYKFKEIFTKTKYKTINGCESDYDLIVGETIPITPFCSEKELLKGKITKKRLVEIYSNLNQEMLEKKLQEYSELQEKNKIKELMKKYDN